MAEDPDLCYKIAQESLDEIVRVSAPPLSSPPHALGVVRAGPPERSAAERRRRRPRPRVLTRELMIHSRVVHTLLPPAQSRTRTRRRSFSSPRR
jgi:hypothetical protein